MMASFSLVAIVTEGDPDPSTLLHSLHAQTHAHWELVVADTRNGSPPRVPRRDRSRVRHLNCRGEDAVTVAARGVDAAAGEFIGFAAPSDVLAPGALAAFAAHADADVDMMYSDEDRIAADGAFVDPFYKPGWSPDRLRVQPYTGRLTLLRHSAVDQVGGVRLEAASAYEWDLILRVTEHARRIAHVREVMCHRAGARGPIGGRELADEQRVIEDHLERTSFPARVVQGDRSPRWRLRPALRDEPLVSVVIPTAGRLRMVHGSWTNLVVNCVERLVASSTYDNYEIICVVGDETPDPTLVALQHSAGDRLRIAPNPGPFNFARAINLGAVRARGDYLLLLNDDTEVITPDWIEAMVMYAQQDGVGAVGAKLLFADGRLQHCGIIAPWPGLVGHPCYGFPGDHGGHADHLLLPANYLAVTGACLLTPRASFDEVGGFAPSLPLNYNDVDYCFKLHHRGYRIVYNPDVCLYHFELSSRLSGEVATEEAQLLEDRWTTMLEAGDPYYNPNFLPSTDYLAPHRSLADARVARAGLADGGAEEP